MAEEKKTRKKKVASAETDVPVETNAEAAVSEDVVEVPVDEPAAEVVEDAAVRSRPPRSSRTLP